jgi:hypothetical protein
MTPIQEQAIQELRTAGWAIVAIRPEDTQGVSIDRLESRLQNDAWEHIDDLRSS